MASPARLYQKEMHDNLGFYPTWLPGDPMEIGDAGIFQGGRFRLLSSLKELGIQHEVGGGGAIQDVQYTSSRGTTVKASAGATAAGLAKAEVSIDFSRNGAFVFHASRLRLRRLENRAAVAEQILKAFEKGTWERDWLLVEALHVAERATIIVSQDRAAGVVLTADAALNLPDVSLADPKVGLTVTAVRGKVVHIVGGKKLRPLYSCLRLKDPLIGRPSVQPVQGIAGSKQGAAFSRPAIDELLDS